MAIENAAPSVFSHEILNANPYAFLDDAPLEERRARAVQLRSSTRTEVADGILDPAAIDEVSNEVWPEPRDADEVHDALLTFISGPAIPEWQKWFSELSEAGRVFTLRRGHREFWVATERRDSIDDTLATVRGWMECLGPITATDLAERLALDVSDVRIALGTLESQGQVFQGHYRKPVHARDRMVQPAHSGAHSPPDARAFAPRNRAGHRRAIPSIPRCAGSTSHPTLSFTARMAYCKSCASCRASRFRRRRGKRAS